MNIQDILPDSHRPTADLAAQLMIKEPALISEFITAIPEQKDVFAMRICRAMAIACESSPEIFNNYASDLLTILLNSPHQGVNRGILKMFQTLWKALDEDQLGQLLDKSFKHLENPMSEIAVRVYAMSIIYETTTIYPELKNELISIIEFHYEEGSAGFKAMSRKILKKLKK